MTQWVIMRVRKERRSDPLRPLRIAALISAGSFALCQFLQIYAQTSVVYVARMFLGNDFSFFYRAAERLASGLDPYQVQGFVTPPSLSRFLASAGISSLPFEIAAQGMFLMTIGCLIAALTISVQFFLPAETRSRRDAFLLGLLLLVTGYPTYFLVDRGNVDGLVVLFVSLFLAFLAQAKRYREEKELAAGLCLGIAAAIKVYPVLLLLPVLIYRRWRIVLGFSVALSVCVAADPEAWTYFVTTRAGERISWFGLNECAGIFTFFGLVNELAKLWFAADWGTKWIGTASLGTLAVFLGVLAIQDLRRARKAGPGEIWRAVVLYIPFTVTLPQLAYSYMLVNLIPFVIALCEISRRHRDGGAVSWIAAVGVGLCQLQVIAFAALLSRYFPPDLTGAFGGISLFVVLCGSVALGSLARSETQNLRSGQVTLPSRQQAS